jgi:hypothetical protein
VLQEKARNEDKRGENTEKAQSGIKRHIKKTSTVDSFYPNKKGSVLAKKPSHASVHLKLEQWTNGIKTLVSEPIGSNEERIDISVDISPINFILPICFHLNCGKDDISSEEHRSATHRKTKKERQLALR